MMHFLFHSYAGGLLVGAACGYGFRGLVARLFRKAGAEIQRGDAYLRSKL